MKRSELIFTAILVPLDFFMLILAGMSAYFLRTSSFVAEKRPVLFNLNLPIERYLEIIAVVSLIWLVIFALSGMYKIKRSNLLLEEFIKIVIATSTGLVLIVVYIFIKREWFDSRFIILAAWLFAILFISLGRLAIRKIQKYLIHRHRIGIHKVLVIGKDSISKKIIDEFRQKPGLGYQLIKHLQFINLRRIRAIKRMNGFDDIILADPDFPREEILSLVDFCNEKRINFKFVPNLFQTLTTNIEIDILSSVPIIELKKTSLDGWGKIIKRIIDIIGSSIGLIILLPFFILIGILIKLDSEGPVFVKLKRISQGNAFYFYKFRSMIKNAEKMKKYLVRYNERKDGPLFKIKNDPRITKFGRFLRKTRIDELPQLFNVLKGEMSLIGPRPHQPDEIAQYKKHHKKVLAIKPGMTGMAQVSGSSGLAFEEEVKLDTYYIENWSLFLDFKILLKTFLILFVDRTAC